MSESNNPDDEANSDDLNGTSFLFFKKRIQIKRHSRFHAKREILIITKLHTQEKSFVSINHVLPYSIFIAFCSPKK